MFIIYGLRLPINDLWIPSSSVEDGTRNVAADRFMKPKPIYILKYREDSAKKDENLEIIWTAKMKTMAHINSIYRHDDGSP